MLWNLLFPSKLEPVLLETWNRYQRYPLGKSFFNWILWLNVPYTGSIRPEVLELSPGHARVRIKDRRLLRNHLNSIHAAALMNLAEVTSGLAFVVGVPKTAKAIVTGFQMEYLKKARGTLIGECDCQVPASNEVGEYEVEALIKNAEGVIVAKGRARWRVGPL